MTQTHGRIEYTARQGDTFDLIALAAYHEERLAHVIMQANPELMDTLVFEGGEPVVIPIISNPTTPDSLPPWRR